MYTHLKNRKFYEDIYDRHTVELGRRTMASFESFQTKWFEMMPEEKPDSHRSIFNLNWIYMLMSGSDLVDRYDKREEHIHEMMAEDEAKDEQIAKARLTVEPICVHCSKTGLRIFDKSLMHRTDFDTPEEVLFMLECPHCSKNSAYWEDGSQLEHRKTYCPKCQTVMAEEDARKEKIITTTYTCSSCGHSYKTKLDLRSPKKEVPDPDFERDRQIYCLLDEKVRTELQDAKRRLEGMVELSKEFKEREDNKHIYDAVAEIKRLKIAELSSLLAPVLGKAGYVEFTLDKPEMGKHVLIGFNCLDSKSDREDYDSRKSLKKLVETTLNATNWRLTSEGISYRLGYLNGRIRAYESEEDLKQLVVKDSKLKKD